MGAGCGGPASPMLHELERYAGLVELNGIGGATITGRLAFDRQAGNLQFSLQEPEFVSLFREESGEVKAFTGGLWRTAREAEVGAFELVEAAVRHRPVEAEAPVPSGDGYTIILDGTGAGRELFIRLIEETDPHVMR